MPTFYISPDGSDSYTSTEAQSPLTPWAHPPGDMVTDNSSDCAGYTATTNDVFLFERGSYFVNQQNIRIVGYDNLTFGAYGTGADPIYHVGRDWTGQTWTREGTSNNYSSSLTEGHSRLILDPVDANGAYDSDNGVLGIAAPAGRPLIYGWANSTLDDSTPSPSIVDGVLTHSITGIATHATDPVVTTGSAHGLATGDNVLISGVSTGTFTGGYPAINTTHAVTVLTSTTFSVTGVECTVAATDGLASVSRTWKKTGITSKPFRLAGSLGPTGGGGWDDCRTENASNGTPVDTDSTTWPPLGHWSYNAADDAVYVTVGISNTIAFNNPAQDDDGIYIVYDLDDDHPWYYEDYSDGVETGKLWVMGNGATNPGAYWNEISVYQSTQDWISYDTVTAFGNTTWPFTRWRSCMAITDSDNLEISDIDFRGGLANSITVLNNDGTSASNVTNIEIHDISVKWTHGENMITLMGLSDTLQMSNIHVEDVLVDRGTLSSEALGYETGGGDNLWIYGGIKDSWMKRIESRGCTHTHIDIENDYNVASTAMENILVEDLDCYRDNSSYCRPYQTGVNGTNDTHMTGVVIRRLNTFYGDLNVNPHTSGANVTIEFSIFKIDKHPDYGWRSSGMDFRGYVDKSGNTPATHITARNLTVRNNLFLYCGECGIFVVDGGSASYPFEGTFEIYNNIFYEWNQEGAAEGVNFAFADNRRSTATDTSTFNLHHNCMYQASGHDPIQWRTAAGGTIDYATVAAAEAAEDEIWANVQGDPGFVSPSSTSTDVAKDFSLSAGANAQMAGYEYTGWDSAVDYKSASPQNSLPDMGAFWSGDSGADVVIATTVYVFPGSNATGVDVTTTKLGGRTPKGCLVFLSNGTTDGPALGSHDSDMCHTFGFTADNATGITDACSGGGSVDAVASSSTATRYGSTVMARLKDSDTRSFINFDSFVTNGVKLNYTFDVESGQHAVIMFFAGDDVECSAIEGTFSADTNPQSFTFGGTNPVRPDLLFVTGNGGSLSVNGSIFMHSMGVCSSHNQTIQHQSALGWQIGTGQTDQRAGITLSTDSIYMKHQISSLTYKTPVTSIEPDGFTLTPSAAPGATDDFYAFGVMVKGAATWSGRISSPTSTGDEAYTGVGFEPQGLGFLGSFLTSAQEDALVASGEGCLSYCIGLLDDTDQYVHGGFHEDNTGGDSNAGSIYESTALRIPTEDGTESTSTSLKASLTSLDEDGFTLNYSAVDSAAKRIIAYGIEAPLEATTGVGNGLGTRRRPLVARGRKLG